LVPTALPQASRLRDDVLWNKRMLLLHIVPHVLP
jgi:hypothetical protein